MLNDDELQNYQPDAFMYSKPVLEAVESANEFCLLTEAAQSEGKENFIPGLLKIISLLYSRLQQLEVPEEYAGESEQKFVSEADWTYIENIIKTTLGPDNRVVSLRVPEKPEETAETEISECLADIYQTFKDFALLYELGYEDAAETGIYELKQLFKYHTGPRMLLVLSEMHDLINSPQGLSNNEPELPPDKPKHSQDDKELRIERFFGESKKT